MALLLALIAPAGDLAVRDVAGRGRTPVATVELGPSTVGVILRWLGSQPPGRTQATGALPRARVPGEPVLVSRPGPDRASVTASLASTRQWLGHGSRAHSSGTAAQPGTRRRRHRYPTPAVVERVMSDSGRPTALSHSPAPSGSSSCQSSRQPRTNTKAKRVTKTSL